MGLEGTRGMSSGDATITIEEIFAVLSPEEYEVFINIMTIADDIIDNESKYTGNKALFTAMRLASFRTKLGVYAQYYKTSSKSETQRKRKDLLMMMYSALEENINTLKLLGRTEARMTGGFN